MIKANFYIKLDGTTTSEQENGLLQLTANVRFFADAGKEKEISQRTYTFTDVSLQNATLQYVYGRLSQEFENPVFV